MPTEFQPIFRNAHLLTMGGNFWPREIDFVRFPAERVEYRTDERTTVVAYEHQPKESARGQIVFLHGLEGSANAGYIASFGQQALERGYGIHRLNIRNCGGTEALCETMYHSGLTGDTKFVLERLHERSLGPCFLAGFSLGGNIALKLAGELGETDLLSGVCAVSPPIDLAACSRAIGRPGNFIYARRFINRLRERVRRKNALFPHLYSTVGLDSVKTIWQFDDEFTAPLFSFGTAANYYQTQSSGPFLSSIRVPSLIVTAQDDPLVPFDMYRNEPAFKSNPALTLIAPKHGGHLGFLSRRKPRFWLDGVCLEWIDSLNGYGHVQRQPDVILSQAGHAGL